MFGAEAVEDGADKSGLGAEVVEADRSRERKRALEVEPPARLGSRRAGAGE